MNKKVHFWTAALLIVSAASLYAQEAMVAYIDGYVDIRDRSGERVEAWEGDSLYIGDAVITDYDSYAELENETSGALITIAPETVFLVSERETSRGRETVLTTTLGSVSYKFGKAFENEPAIATPSMVAGIRGTEFTVFAGVDGSSLIAVESGQVDVTSEGETVELFPQEGVEVKPGEKPGDKFEILRGQLDFSSWNGERFDEFLDDPEAAVSRIESRMNSLLDELNVLVPEYRELREQLAANKAEYDELREAEGKDAARPYYKENVEPIMLRTSPLYKNIRYYALSAFSLKRYVLGRLYMEMKTRYITRSDSPEYRAFSDGYHNIVDAYESGVVPFLVEDDI